MIVFNKNVDNITKNWTNDYYIVMDFDRTITCGDSETSWGILSKTNLLPPEYIKSRQELFSYYHPIELDYNIKVDKKNILMKEWYQKHIDLLIKYQLQESMIEKCILETNLIKLRDGVKDFFYKMNERKIPIIIMSAGIGNIIEEVLKVNNVFLDNIFIVSNFLTFTNGYASSIKSNIIHSLNKNTINLPPEINKLIENKQNVILFGDLLDDIKMVPQDNNKQILKIGFLNENIEENKELYQKYFDIVCDKDSNYFDIMKQIKIFD